MSLVRKIGEMAIVHLQDQVFFQKMNYRKDTFIRHAGNESLLWNRRTSACEILQDAKSFLVAISYEPQSEEEIIHKVAKTFACKPDDVSEDVREFLKMLVNETFAETDEKKSAFPELPDHFTGVFVKGGEQKDESWTPLGSFFEKHHLPVELHIDLTNGCTERCIHCYIPDYTPHFLPLDTVKKVLNEFRVAGGLTIHFSGGECMMHPDFAEILRYAKKLHLNMLILSNLTLCDEKKVELLKEIDPQFINVSLYSMTPEIHDSITTLKGSWEKTMGAILALEKAGVHIRLAAPLMKNNQDGFDELKKFADEHHMHLIPDCDIFGQTDHDCSNQSCALSPEELGKNLCRYRNIFHFAPGEEERYLPEHKVCDIGKSRIDINAEGDYYPCDGCHGIVLGNAATHTFSEVWQGEKLNALRALKNRDFPGCAECENRKWCKVCPARNFNETGDMFKHTPARCIAAAIKRKIYGE